MDRIQKRCFVASLTLHSVLLGIVLFGAAFLGTRPQEENIPVLTFIPAIATDGRFAGGGSRSAGNPAPAQPAPTTPATRPQPAPAPTEQPQTVPPSRAAARETPTPRPITRTPEAVEPVATPRRPSLPQSALRPIERGAKPSATARANTRPAARNTQTTDSPSTSSNQSNERSQLARRINDSINRIGSGASGSTAVEMPGDGSGGPSYAPYAAIIKTIYTEAWVTPEDLHDDLAIADVEVEVARDGTVISRRILKPSGNARVDRSVQEVLNRVRFIKEFPSSWKEQRRTFQIRFNLKVKEQLLG